jgi:hypothetical protein
MRDYNKSEAEELMKDLVIRGKAYVVLEAAGHKSRSGVIMKDSFVKTLFEEGLIDHMEGNKIVSALSRDGQQLNLNHFRELIESARKSAFRDSEAVKKFYEAMRSHGKFCCQQLEKADLNKDGQIGLETFLSSFLTKQVRM